MAKTYPTGMGIQIFDACERRACGEEGWTGADELLSVPHMHYLAGSLSRGVIGMRGSSWATKRPL